MAPRYMFPLGLLCLVMAGCAFVATDQDWRYKLAQQHRAAESYRASFSAEQRHCQSCDFKAGFKTGYYETSIGRDCRVPPVAPPKYWTAHYQNCEGQASVQDWFNGYQAGIASAFADGHRYFHEVPVSNQAPIVNKTACGMCQSREPCACRVEQVLISPMHGMENHSAAVSQSDAKAASKTKAGSQTALSRDTATDPSEPNAVPEIGLIGGFGATNINLIGPMDAAVLHQ